MQEIFTEEIIQIAARLNLKDSLTELLDILHKHKVRYVYKTSLSPQLENATDPKVFFGNNCLRYILLLLFRSKSLIEGAIICLNNKKMLPSLICVRSHLETTSGMAFLLSRLNSYYAKGIEFSKVEEDLFRLSVGATKIEKIEVPRPINVMDMIDAADHLISKMVAVIGTTEKALFRDLYDWLSDFCHPNFQGTCGGAEIDHKDESLIFYDTDVIHERDFPHFFSLNLSAILFLDFFDKTLALLEEKEIMPIIHKTANLR